MKAIIERTSYYKDEKPCEEAIDSGMREKFCNRERRIWVMEFNHLSELIYFVEKYQQEKEVRGCIIYPKSRDISVEHDFCIEIYDEYRE
jgi:hypothetical protein